MIPIPSGVRVWIATGHTDMRRGMQGLALQVQESLKRDPHAGDLYIFRGRRGDLAKILWHDGIGLSLYAKRLDRGKFIWPSASGDAVSISAALKAELAVARAKASEDAALIVQQTLRIAKLERQVYGQKSERSARLIDQLALTLEELEANATEDELAAEQAVAKTTTVVGFTRKRAERNTFPDHLCRRHV